MACSILTWDHTFKVSKDIGVTRSEDSVFVNQFENLFIGLNRQLQKRERTGEEYGCFPFV